MFGDLLLSKSADGEWWCGECRGPVTERPEAHVLYVHGGGPYMWLADGRMGHDFAGEPSPAARWFNNAVEESWREANKPR